MNSKIKTVLKAGRQCVIGLCLVLLITFAWATGGWNSTASAESLTSSVQDAAQELDRGGKAALDEVAGAGTSSQIEGQVNKTAGELQEQSAKASANLEGAGKQAKGNVQQAIGNAQEKSENFFESVGDFFTGK